MKTTTSIKAAAIATLHFTLSILNFTAHGAVIQQVIVRQQWPWSMDVKVEYKLAEVTSPVDISVKAFNGNTELPLPAEAVSGDLYGISESGIGQFIIDPVKAFGNTKVAIADFRVELELSDSAANMVEVLYKIYDLASGSCTDVTRGDLLGHKYGTIETNYTAFTGFNTPISDVIIWTGVTNDVKYATTHLVMRKIPAKDQTFKMGLRDGTQRNVTMTNDFYMGVFEVTQYQYWKLTDSWPSMFSLEECRDTRPVDFVTWTNIRGAESTVGGAWPTNLSHDVTSGSFLGNLRAALNGAPKIDLPTDAQWEYACRAKCTNDWYNGYDCYSMATDSKPLELAKIARYRYSGGYGPNGYIIGTNYGIYGTTNGTARVGSYLPNAWGLYDMAGNVREWCLDWYAAYSSEDATEPAGPEKSDSNGNRTLRGGCIFSEAGKTQSAYREDRHPSISWDNGDLGFRLCLTVTE